MCTICNLLISLCVHMPCVCARAPESVLMMASSQLCESFSSQRINDCSHFAFLLLQAYYCSLIPDALGVRAGCQHFPWRGFTTALLWCTGVSFYPSLCCSLGPDWGTLIHALWTLLILYIAKWKQEKHPRFTWHHALDSDKPLGLAVSVCGPPDTENQDIPRLTRVSQGSVKWFSSCQDLPLSQCLQKTSLTWQLEKQIYKEQKDNMCLKNKFRGGQVQVGNYINQL